MHLCKLTRLSRQPVLEIPGASAASDEDEDNDKHAASAAAE